MEHILFVTPDIQPAGRTTLSDIGKQSDFDAHAATSSLRAVAKATPLKGKW